MHAAVHAPNNCPIWPAQCCPGQGVLKDVLPSQIIVLASADDMKKGSAVTTALKAAHAVAKVRAEHISEPQMQHISRSAPQTPEMPCPDLSVGAMQ